ncbi:MAG TPA: IS21-like element helper ATPase IstB [Armatimonadota bacterium]
MTPLLEEQAQAALEKLGLKGVQERLDGACQRAAAESWSYSAFLGYLLDAEVQERHRRSVEFNLKFARFPLLKRLADFDFEALPSLDRRLIEELSTLRFLYEGRNLVFLGAPGVGKTHLALGLGLLACERGHRAYFTSAIELARKLSLAFSENRLHREMRKLLQPKVLILDEVGYLTLDNTQASLLFQALCHRYERSQSVILTSNKAFGEWGEISAGDAVMAAAALDRLLHRCTVVHIRGESYRLRERKRAGVPLDVPSTGPADSPSASV